MANQRSKDKVYVAGWLPVGLAAGIERWLERNPGKNRTDFMVVSGLDKLLESGIAVELPADYSRTRPRKELPEAAYAQLKEVTPAYKTKKKTP